MPCRTLTLQRNTTRSIARGYERPLTKNDLASDAGELYIRRAVIFRIGTRCPLHEQSIIHSGRKSGVKAVGRPCYNLSTAPEQTFRKYPEEEETRVAMSTGVRDVPRLTSTYMNSQRGDTPSKACYLFQELTVCILPQYELEGGKDIHKV